MSLLTSIQELSVAFTINGLREPISITLHKDSYYKILFELLEMSRVYETDSTNPNSFNSFTLNFTGGSVKIIKEIE